MKSVKAIKSLVAGGSFCFPLKDDQLGLSYHYPGESPFVVIQS